jgi:hypothetical protein
MFLYNISGVDREREKGVKWDMKVEKESIY